MEYAVIVVTKYIYFFLKWRWREKILLWYGAGFAREDCFGLQARQNGLPVGSYRYFSTAAEGSFLLKHIVSN